MAGTATWTKDDSSPHGYYGFTVWKCNWVSNSSGAVSAGIGVDSQKITGILLGVNFISDPDAIPTDAYDVQLLNAAGQNILYDSSTSTNLGANVPSAITSQLQKRTPSNVDGYYITLYQETITPSITNAGDTRKGTIEVIVY